MTIFVYTWNVLAVVKVTTFNLCMRSLTTDPGIFVVAYLTYRILLHQCVDIKAGQLCFAGVWWSVWITWGGQQWGMACLSACCVERLWGCWELLQSSALTAARYNTTTFNSFHRAVGLFIITIHNIFTQPLCSEIRAELTVGKRKCAHCLSQSWRESAGYSVFYWMSGSGMI